MRLVLLFKSLVCICLLRVNFDTNKMCSFECNSLNSNSLNESTVAQTYYKIHSSVASKCR